MAKTPVEYDDKKFIKKGTMTKEIQLASGYPDGYYYVASGISANSYTIVSIESPGYGIVPYVNSSNLYNFVIVASYSKTPSGSIPVTYYYYKKSDIESSNVI